MGGPGKILLVRFGPAAVYPYLQYFPPDAALPPLQVQNWLFPYDDEEPPDDVPGAELCDDLTTAWEISEEEHTFKNKWWSGEGRPWSSHMQWMMGS